MHTKLQQLHEQVIKFGGSDELRWLLLYLPDELFVWFLWLIWKDTPTVHTVTVPRRACTLAGCARFERFVVYMVSLDCLADLWHETKIHPNISCRIFPKAGQIVRPIRASFSEFSDIPRPSVTNLATPC